MLKLKLRQIALLSYGLLIFAATWLLTAGPAWAQGDSPAANKSYVVPYLMVILIVAVALLIVLKPAGRTSEVKAKDTI